jgi:hypothetical protein
MIPVTSIKLFIIILYINIVTSINFYYYPTLDIKIKESISNEKCTKSHIYSVNEIKPSYEVLSHMKSVMSTNTFYNVSNEICISHEFKTYINEFKGCSVTTINNDMIFKRKGHLHSNHPRCSLRVAQQACQLSSSIKTINKKSIIFIKYPFLLEIKLPFITVSRSGMLDLLQCGAIGLFGSCRSYKSLDMLYNDRKKSLHQCKDKRYCNAVNVNKLFVISQNDDMQIGQVIMSYYTDTSILLYMYN